MGDYDNHERVFELYLKARFEEEGHPAFHNRAGVEKYLQEKGYEPNLGDLPYPPENDEELGRWVRRISSLLEEEA